VSECYLALNLGHFELNLQNNKLKFSFKYIFIFNGIFQGREILIFSSSKQKKLK